MNRPAGIRIVLRHLLHEPEPAATHIHERRDSITQLTYNAAALTPYTFTQGTSCVRYSLSAQAGSSARSSAIS
ncbi:hypothetical protein NITLEN_80086 [Nitrospira lenta]|uniref:Uncharacterized protein n=1 Tax=Nitrospira lenta TaxID=1436998 RepID=A0A330LBH1_9BACT|nr:hypothetical protein NITLEN_80086 [Nitrospira lenta]